MLCAHAYLLALPLGQYPLGILPDRWRSTTAWQKMGTCQKRRRAKPKTVWHPQRTKDKLQKYTEHARRFGGGKVANRPKDNLCELLRLLEGMAAEKWPAALKSPCEQRLILRQCGGLGKHRKTLHPRHTQGIAGFKFRGSRQHDLLLRRVRAAHPMRSWQPQRAWALQLPPWARQWYWRRPRPDRFINGNANDNDGMGGRSTFGAQRRIQHS